MQFSRCVEGISRSFKTIQRSRRVSSEQFLFRAVSDPGQSLRLSASSHPLTRFRFVFLLLRPHSSRNSDVRPRILSSTLTYPSLLPRKEVIQPHLPIRLPCYDFTPVISLTFDGCALAVHSPASGAPNSHGVTGGVYKARERIHRGILIRDY